MVGYGVHRLGIENDLDLEGETISEAFWMDSIILIPLTLLSNFYSRLLRRLGGHRGILSHGFFISSLIRLCWFSLPFLLVFRHYFVDSLWREYLGVFLGLSLADTWHSLADYGTTEGLPFLWFKGKQSQIIKWFLKKRYDFPPDNTIKKKINSGVKR